MNQFGKTFGKNKCFKYVTVSFIQHPELIKSVSTPKPSNEPFSNVVGHKTVVLHSGKSTLTPKTGGLRANIIVKLHDHTDWITYINV